MKSRVRSSVVYAKLNRRLFICLIFLCSVSALLVYFPDDFYNKEKTDVVSESSQMEEDASDIGTISSDIVTIDAGHGGYDPGKVGVDGTKEKDVNLQIALYLRDALTAQGIRTVLTRETDTALYTESAGSKKMSDLNHRVQIAADHASDLLVSIHQNSFSDSSVHGAQTFYFEGSEEGNLLAASIQNAICVSVDPDNERPIKGNAEYLLLKKSPCTAVIVECGFLSNPTECSHLASADYQKQLADAIADGICSYLSNLSNGKS